MFSFGLPWLLICLPLSWLAIKVIPKTQEQSAALKIPFFQAATKWRSDDLGSVINKRFILLHLIWILLVIAAAAPRWVGPPIEMPRTGRDIMIAVDLSGSMKTRDMTLDGRAVDRLQVIKAVAGKFIQRRVGDRLGLILFGTRAYLQTPLTFDTKTVQAMLNDATIGLPGSRTAIGDAIGLGIKRLMNYPKDSRVLILMTDGVNNSGAVGPIPAAKMAAKEGIRIYTIGLGASRVVRRGPFGRRYRTSDLDEKALKEIAKITGGKYFRAQDGDQLKQIYTDLDRLEPIPVEGEKFRPITPLYPWPLGFAFLFSMVFLFQTMNWSFKRA